MAIGFHLVALLISLFASIIDLSAHAQQLPSNRLSVKSINFYTSTDTQITCDQFQKIKVTPHKINVVTNSDSLRILDSFIQKSKYETSNFELDTRARFDFYSDNRTTVSICINFFYVVVSGKKVNNGSNFLAFLKSMIPPGQLLSGRGNKYKQ